MPKSMLLLGDNIPLVEAYYTGLKQRPTAIVLRTSFTTGEYGSAFAIAKTWHQSWNKEDSCHYVIDEMQTIRCVKDNLECKSVYTPGLNKRAIVINVCHEPPFEPLERVVYRTSKQVARLCRLHRIKLRLLDAEAQQKWLDRPWKRRGGIILATVGDFPTNRFITSVQEEYKKFD